MIYSKEQCDKILEIRGLKPRNAQPRPRAFVSQQKTTELDGILYAPSPITGFPCNDFQYLDDPNLAPEIRQAIQQRNQKVVSDMPTSDNDDVVLDTMQRNGESAIEYHDRMQGFVKELEKSQETQKSE